MIKCHGKADIFEDIKKEYAGSEVVSGEFIYSLEFDENWEKEEIEEGIQEFLDWDTSDAEFVVSEHPLGHWVVYEDDLPF